MSSINNEPVRKKRRYFFAYHSVHGIIFPFAWVEEEGLCVGGRPSWIGELKWEITPEEFEGPLGELEEKHPVPIEFCFSA